MMKATDERANVSECVSGPTTRQCFSPMSQDAAFVTTTDRSSVRRKMPHNERKRTTNDPACVSVSRIGRVYVASVGRVRVAGACPLLAMADACEWARVFG